jgi:ATP-dependent helicase YprA (DUF1998 family)
MNETEYSIATMVGGLKGILQQYLESQYHIWDESLVEERRLLLEEPGVVAQRPYVEATPFYGRLDSYDAINIPQLAREILSACAKVEDSGIFSKPYVHQANALEAFLTRKRNLIVATGTGSGKTETFLMPILGGLALESMERQATAGQPGCRALLLYPMNALVNDQLARLRRLFGNSHIAEKLQRDRGRRVRFGMYTSRTPYPGKPDALRDKEVLGARLKKLFAGITEEKRKQLERLGMWPAKDMLHFQHRGYQTAATDSEMYTREEMQRFCPDLLVTNYSMLEYMLLRPVESQLFSDTSKWLQSNPQNYLTIVLDEAHMYRGSGGAEVALLLRRLQSRLEVDAKKFRFILTSASLGSTGTDQKVVAEFASDLTGALANSFELIESKRQEHARGGPANKVTAQSLAAIDRRALHSPLTSTTALERVAGIIEQMARLVGEGPQALHSIEAVRQRAFHICEKLPVACHLSNLVTGSPTPAGDLAQILFPGAPTAEQAVEGLIALVTFAFDSSDRRPFLPLRLHLLFRGLGGVYACVDPKCSVRRGSHSKPRLGRLYATPRLYCDCGARVYELLTHRRCGAAFLRGFWRENDERFLWHEAPRGQGPVGERLLEVHLLVEPERSRPGDRQLYLHIRTGRVVEKRSEENLEEYLTFRCATGQIQGVRAPMVSYDKQCPVCMKRWTEDTQIMDLQTKGEAPFAYLIREQVRLQPATRMESPEFPNAGRKTLLFSDGRQKAARLARDIPRDVAKDTFRQLLVIAVGSLLKINREAVPNSRTLYRAFIYALASRHLQLFDGSDGAEIERQARNFKQDYKDLEEALDDNSESQPPAQYQSLLLMQLGSPFYSLFALTLGFAFPRKRALRRIAEALPTIEPGLLGSIAIIWIQNLLDRYAFMRCAARVREVAAGYRRDKPDWGETTGFRMDQTKLVQKLTGIPSGKINDVLFEQLCVTDETNASHFLLDPDKIAINLAFDRNWFQCGRCTYLSPVTWSNVCPNCTTPEPLEVNPDESPYLRTRKNFWRAPVLNALSGASTPMSLQVEEHTAQLGHRDPEDVASTTEIYERRFRDVLIHATDRPIDVLSCTTTMEVGIDIGSLVAVGLRNMPPQRQNYQQRAGRAGRRGTSFSTVVTYAQNNPHDDFFFRDPKGMLVGDPPAPFVDTTNPKLVQRHVNAQLLQSYFHAQIGKVDSAEPGIYSTWGATMDFYENKGEFTLNGFRVWVVSKEAEPELRRVKASLLSSSAIGVVQIRDDAINAIVKAAPVESPNSPDDQLLEYFFSKAVLPAYAFPRDLLSLRIEELTKRQIELQQAPQQGLNVALSEYAPGRFVVVDKLTYQVGSVTANQSSSVTNRAAPLFDRAVRYIQCTNCFHTQEMYDDFAEDRPCASCQSGILRVTRIIQPEVAYPRRGKPIDELSDDPLFTDVTAAQLPFPGGGKELVLEPYGERCTYAFGHNENLVVVNRGFEAGVSSEGFLVCELCGYVLLPGDRDNPTHDRDYHVRIKGRTLGQQCRGRLQPVFLGYTFPTDLLLLRINLKSPFNSAYDVPERRRPLVDAVRSFSEALSLAASRELQIDVRELKSGFRFLEIAGERCADVFLYDALAGGAGYSTLAGKVLERVFAQARVLLASCDCSSSCNQCLRTYENRLFQTSLNRYMGQDFLAYASAGATPELPDATTHAVWVRPLRLALELEGWTVVPSQTAELIVDRDGTRRTIVCYPSLLDPETLDLAPQTCPVARYDVENRLPDVFAGIV